MLELRNWMTARFAPLALLATCAFFGVLLAWKGVDDKSAALHGALFLAGPVLLVMDRFRNNPTYLWQHHTETALRVAALVGLYFLVPSTVVSMMGYLWNFFAIYMCAWSGLQNFIVRPTHWLRHDNKAHTAFLAVLVLGILGEIALKSVLVGVGTTFLAAMTVVVLIAWRHALWYNVHRELSAEQHAAVWPAHAARLSSGPTFWQDVQKYAQRYPPVPLLNALSVPVLLSFFTTDSTVRSAIDPFASGDKDSGSPLVEDIKTAVNAKEPRAVFVWQLYPEKEAAIAIGQIEGFAANEVDTLDLPNLGGL